MDLNYIKKLVKLVEESNISEIEVEQNDSRIKVTKNAIQTSYSPVIQTGAYIPAPSEANQTAQPKTTEPAKPAAPAANMHEVKSPIVGTFYRASNPESEPFVKVGDTVTSGQTLCIIEAMKLMNEIESDVSGTIVKILVENGRAVEYNQPLFVIET